MTFNRKAACVILIVVPLLCFGHALSNGFVGDDTVKLVDTRYYSNPSGIATLFSKAYLSPLQQYRKSQVLYTGSGELSYRPVCSLTYFFDRAVWKLDPFGYHLTNLLIHIFNVLLVYLCFCRLTKNDGVAFLTALFFAVHPIQAEIVNAISYRHGLLATFFSLLMLIFYAAHSQNGKAGTLVLSAALFFLALLSMESAAFIVFLLPVYDTLFSPRAKIRWEKMFVFFCIEVFYVYVYFILFPSVMVGANDWRYPAGYAHIALVLQTMSYYMASLLFPFSLKLLPLTNYPVPERVLWITLGQGVVFLAACCLPFYFKTKNKIPLFGSLWFLINILPVVNLLILYNPLAHRRMYLPSIGMFLMMAYVLQALPQIVPWPRFKKIYRSLLITLIGLCMVLSSQLTAFWKNNLAYAQEVTRLYPWDKKAYFIVGAEFFGEGIKRFQQGDCAGAVTFVADARRFGVHDERISEITRTCMEKNADVQ